MKRKQLQEQPLLYAPPPPSQESCERPSDEREKKPSRGVSQVDFYITPTQED